MRRFVIGDIHGCYDKLLDVLRQVEFDYNNDELISLGDVVDRGPDSFLCVEELLKIVHGIFIRGNHDETFRQSIVTGEENVLYNQGGRETMLSYTRDTECGGDPCKIPFEHIEFFMHKQKDYHIDAENNLFIHGGFNRHYHLVDQTETTFHWDRDLFMTALSFSKIEAGPMFKMKDKFNHIYIGHTPTVFWNTDRPITACNITNMDTGCGKGGSPLSMMNLETKELIQSFK